MTAYQYFRLVFYGFCERVFTFFPIYFLLSALRRPFSLPPLPSLPTGHGQPSVAWPLPAGSFAIRFCRALAAPAQNFFRAIINGANLVFLQQWRSQVSNAVEHVLRSHRTNDATEHTQTKHIARVDASQRYGRAELAHTIRWYCGQTVFLFGFLANGSLCLAFEMSHPLAFSLIKPK